jgi:3-oxoacyl-[acyl-carrier protein] reductase
MNLSGKNAIVTGGVSGLGLCMVEKLIAKAARVTVFDVSTQGLELLANRHPSVNCVYCDVSNYDQVVAATAQYHDKFGAADVLINNAGILYSAPLAKFTAAGIEKHDVEMWNRVLATDLSSVFYMTACVVEHLIKTRTRGVIVNISSVSAAGNVGQSAYSAAKAGVNALTATWAKELGPLGIRVVAIAPGYSDTESTKLALGKSTLEEIVQRVPLRRLGKPEEIADGVLSVIENDFFHGKVVELDGGLVV